MKIHSGDKSNKCNQCNYASLQAGDLRKHLKTHSGEKSNKCNASNLKEHLMLSHAKKQNELNYQQKILQKILNDEEAEMYSGEKSNKCNQCDYVFSYASDLRTHMKKHSGETVEKQILNDKETEETEESMDGTENIQTQMETKTAEIREEQREEITFVDVEESNESQSIDVEENNDSEYYDDGEIFKCKECYHKATTKHNLLNHSKTHTKPYECVECGAKFSENSKLKKHILGIHEGQKKHICPHCKFKSNDRGQYNHHVGMVHSNKGTLYKCERCEKSFGEKGKLKNHQNVHDKVYQFPCKNCSKICLTQQKLTQHNLSHREKNIKCNLCEKLFKEKKKLTLHTNTHTKENIFPCRICTFSSTQKSNLTVHMKKKHANEK